jgi:carbonic anhydrase
MTVRYRVAAVVVMVLGAAVGAAGPEDPAPLTPREALGSLKAGNDRYVRNASSPVSLSINRRQELAAAQRPAAMVLSCADSRLPPEHVFNTGLGEIFVVRTAGGVVDRSVLATLEYGADRLHIPLLVVMGHESCGAVLAAAEGKNDSASANMQFLMKAIRAARRQSAEERDEVKALVLANVEQVINDLMSGSPLLQRLLDTGKLDVVGGYYELVSGRVIFSEPVTPALPAARETRR